MPSRRYRVTVNGFRCDTQTWDDTLQRDGKGDEVQIVTDVTEMDKDGQGIGPPLEKTTPVMGDTNGPWSRVQAGSISSKGGIQSGDLFPTNVVSPWKRASNPFVPDPRDVPPFIVWEGDLVQNENIVFITETIWEWDIGTDIFTGLLNWQINANAQFGKKAKEIVGGVYPVANPVFDAVDLGIQTLETLLDTVSGRPGTRPIGMQKDASGTKYTFTPKILPLTFDLAEKYIGEHPSGLDLGIVAFRYKDDDALGGGDYTLYLQVEPTGAILPDVDLNKDGQTYQEVNAPEIYVLFGGAKFWVPNLDTLNRLYGGSASVQIVAANALKNVPTIPRNGTLLKEENKPVEVWLIEDGKRRLITDQALLGSYGGSSAVKTVPDNALSGVPIGTPVTPAPILLTRPEVLFSDTPHAPLPHTLPGLPTD